MVRRSIGEVLDAIGISQDDFDLQYFTGDALPPRDILAAAGTVPFLADRRTVVIRNALRMDLEQVEAKDFKNLPDYAFVVLVADEEGGSDERNRKLSTNQKSLEKMLKASGGGVFEFVADPKTAREVVKTEFQRQNRKITNPALDLLLDMTGSSAGRAMEEAEKLMLFSRSDSITDQDVKAVVVPSREWNIFRLLDSVIAGEMGEAFKQLQSVIVNKTKVEDIAFSSIFPMFSRQLRLFWQARICIEEGVDPSQVPAEVLRKFPDKPNLAKESPYLQGRIMRTARSLSCVQLSQCMAILSDADARLKGARTSFTGLDTIEQMLLAMSKVFRP